MGITTTPTIKLEVGLTGPTVGSDIFHVGDPDRGKIGTGKIGSADIWSDITPWLRSWSFRRGASRDGGPILRYEAGTLTAVLNNGDRAMDPTNTTGPFSSGGVSLLTPMVRVRLTAVWDGYSYRLWYGYADAFTPDYDSPTWSTVTLTATDGFKIFAAIDRIASVSQGANEDSGLRVKRILDAIAWPADQRVIAAGDSLVQATTLEGNVLSELQLVQDTEAGEFWMDVNGKAKFRNRHRLFEDERSTTPQATFGDKPATSATYSYDFESGIGDWAATGGTASSSTAQAYDGTSSLLTTVTGSPTLVYTRRASVTVVPGHRYRLRFRIYMPAAGNVSAAVDWANGGGYLSTGYTNFDVPSAAWTLVQTIVTAPAAATQATFGPTMYSPSVPFTAGTTFYVDALEFVDLDTEIPYSSAPVQNDDATMANRVVITANAGTDQVAEDTVSQQRYLTKTFTKSGLLLQTDADALQYAQFVLYQAKDPELRFVEAVFKVPVPDLAAVAWPTLLNRELGDRVTVIRRPPGGGDPNYRDVFIRGIQMSQTENLDVEIRFAFQSATKFQFFTIGDPSLGRVGYNAIAW